LEGLESVAVSREAGVPGENADSLLSARMENLSSVIAASTAEERKLGAVNRSVGAPLGSVRIPMNVKMVGRSGEPVRRRESSFGAV